MGERFRFHTWSLIQQYPVSYYHLWENWKQKESDLFLRKITPFLTSAPNCLKLETQNSIRLNAGLAELEGFWRQPHTLVTYRWRDRYQQQKTWPKPCPLKSLNIQALYWFPKQLIIFYAPSPDWKIPPSPVHQPNVNRPQIYPPMVMIPFPFPSSDLTLTETLWPLPSWNR